MRAIILAAGKGARLNGVIGTDPKCMLRVGDLTLLERQIQELKSLGVDDVTVVVGYAADRVRQAYSFAVNNFVENTVFDQTNSLYSLWLARDLLSDGFVVMNSDVLFHPQMLKDLITAKYEDALLISYCDDPTVAMGDEEMKVKVRGGRVVDMSKKMDPAEADGENVGVVKFGPTGARLLVEQMNRIIANGGERDWSPKAFLEVAKLRPLRAVSTRGYPWTEIDFPEDFHRAVNEVLPKIEGVGEDAAEPTLLHTLVHVS